MSLALITGSSGHVGSNLIRELTKQKITKLDVSILMETTGHMKVLMSKRC